MNEENLLQFLSYMQVLSLGLYIVWRRRKCKRWINRRWWVRPINERRGEYGDFATLFAELKEDPDLFFRYTRMDVDTFYEFLDMVRPYLQKTSLRKPICPEQRLAITLRYLASGDQVLSVALAYRVGESTARKIIKETCEVIGNVLIGVYLKVPSENEWKHISRNFLTAWNLPNCLGAIDGKHITLQAPPHSGSLYFNYKKTFSIVLMAACDSNYKFTLFDVGAFGGESDGGILSRSAFGKALYENKLNIPKVKTCFPGSGEEIPFYFVGDEAFQMSTQMMRPYPGRHLNEVKRIFNYRLSRARRTIENTFGILVSRWRIFRKSICASPDVAEKLVVAAMCLHNYLKSKNDGQLPQNQRYCPNYYVDRENTEGNIIGGGWRERIDSNLQSMSNGPHRATTDAYAMRNTLASYFLTPAGEVPWQYEYIRRGQYNDMS